jgi:hypothetical protein
MAMARLRCFGAFVAMIGGALGLACSTFGEDETKAGSQDAGPGESEAPRPFCATQPSSLFLCDDFDDAPPAKLGFKWTENTALGGVNERDTIDFRSPPFSFVGRSTNDGQGWAYLEKELTAPGTRIVTSFDLRIDELGSTYALLYGLRLFDPTPGSNQTWSVYLRSTPSGSLDIGEADPSGEIGTSPFAKTPVPGKWARLTIDVTLAGAAIVRAFVDGASTPEAEGALKPLFTTGKKRLAVGLTYFSVIGWKAHVDNVTIALSP